MSGSISFKQTFFPLTATDFSDTSTAERQTSESRILEKLSLYNHKRKRLHIAICCYWWYNANSWERMMTRLEFVKIMERCQNGDKKALGILYEEYFGQLFVTAYQILRDTDAACDVATNVVLALLEFKKDVTTIDNHIGYMITMAQNKA